MRTWIAGGAVGRAGRAAPDRVSVLPEDGGHFAGHAVMAPQVGAVGDGLVVDLDDAVGAAAGDGAPGAASSSTMPAVIAIDAEFGAAGEHAVALDAVDHLLAEGHVGGNQCPARQLGAPQTTVLWP